MNIPQAAPYGHRRNAPDSAYPIRLPCGCAPWERKAGKCGHYEINRKGAGGQLNKRPGEFQ